MSQELTIEKRKNELLLRKLREARKTIKAYEQNAKGKTTLKPYMYIYIHICKVYNTLSSSLAHHSNFNSSQMMSDQRCLRSYTRKKRTPCLNSKLDSLRDRNKNVINNIKY